MTDYLVDNSVWARAILGDQGMIGRLNQIDRSPADLVVTCPPQMLEFCHSARSAQEHQRYRDRMSLALPLVFAPDECLVLDIQNALWNAGLVRSAGPLDILIAGYALVNGATVMSADHDFGHIARVVNLSFEYIAPTR
ncbi:PIN domain-containing protein [Luteococcus sp. H138]|uniref:PIN domain-containing protein n=1 Tax=unclassified Luteococcus TaxID=2639923 RepID=UPI00313ADECF